MKNEKRNRVFSGVNENSASGHAGSSVKEDKLENDERCHRGHKVGLIVKMFFCHKVVKG